MQVQWLFEDKDIAAVQPLIRSTDDKSFVRKRFATNVSGPVPLFSRDEVWRAMVGCLLTTQQRSGSGWGLDALKFRSTAE